MTSITPSEALAGNECAIVTRSAPRVVYGLYASLDVAERICRDLNRRYGDAYEVATIFSAGGVPEVRGCAEQIVRSLSLGAIAEGEAVRLIVELASS